MRHIVIALAIVSFPCCGGLSDAPAAPTTSQARLVDLSGFVRSSAGGVVMGAVVKILDGPDAGKEAATDGNGFYGFSGLQLADITLQATATGYVTATQTVKLTANTSLSFQLQRIAVAALTFEGSLVYEFRSGAWDISGTAVNTGDSCATAIAGATTITKGSDSFTFIWSLPATQIIRPAERFTYRLGSMSVADGTKFDGGTYISRATFSTVSCS